MRGQLKVSVRHGANYLSHSGCKALVKRILADLRTEFGHVVINEFELSARQRF